MSLIFGPFKKLEPETCAVCLDSLLVGQDVYESGSCSHVFHKECVTKIVEKGKMKCPICSKPWNASDFPDVANTNIEAHIRVVVDYYRGLNDFAPLINEMVDRLHQENGADTEDEVLTRALTAYVLTPRQVPSSARYTAEQFDNLYANFQIPLDWRLVIDKVFLACFYVYIKRRNIFRNPTNVLVEHEHRAFWRRLRGSPQPNADARASYEFVNSLGDEELERAISYAYFIIRN